MSKNKTHSKFTFQDEWLCNDKYSKWVVKTNQPSEARCLICRKNIDVLIMGVSALELHAARSKHKTLISTRKSTVDIKMMLGTSKQGDKEAKSDTVSQQIEAPANSKAQETVDYLLCYRENTLNAEILRCLRMISSHEGYNSSSDLLEIFQIMFFDSEITAKFSLGKTKSRYTILYGIAAEFKGFAL